MSLRGRRHGGEGQNELIFTTNVPVDDQFSSPRQIRWSAALGKLLISDIANIRFVIRNKDLSFSSKYYGHGQIGVDSDALNIYSASSYSIRKYPSELSTYTQLSVGNGGIRMLDASGDPDYVYATSNNVTDHHGFRQIKKSTMAVTASALADGSGDGQFDDPLGIFYYNSEIFVADYDNSRISVWSKSGETLTYSRKYDLGYKPMDLCFDGVNWFVQSATILYKYDNVFTDATKTSVSNVGYSITLVPDQGDGNGATIAFTDNTNSHIGRRKCSDLTTATADFGSSGDGSSSLFDPTFSTSINTQITYKFDDGFRYTTPLGTSHALSWNGFAGYSFQTPGPHKCTVTVQGGIKLISSLNATSDAIVYIKNVIKLTDLIAFYVGTNTALVFSIDELSQNVTVIYINDSSRVYGNIGKLRKLIEITGNGNTQLTGSLSDITPTIQICKIAYSVAIVASPIAQMVTIRDLRIYSMGWNAAGVDIVLLSASDAVWDAPNHFTYSAPSLQIGGTNPPPGGSSGADTTDPTTTPGVGNSNADWQWDADRSAHKALTGKAAIYFLKNLASHAWNITYS